MQIYQPSITGSLSISGSINLSGSFSLSSGSVMTGTASLATTASYAINATNAVTAQTASFANAFTVAGTLTAQTLVVQTITSSVDFVTGSTRFGSIGSNTHVFTGSMSVSGSGTFVGNITSNGNTLSLINAGGSADFVLGRANTSSGAAINLNTNGVNKWFFGLRGLVDENFYIYNQTAGANNLILNASTGAATFSSSVTLAGNLFWNSGDGVNWYIQGQANGPTIRMKYHGGSADRSGALGWIDNSGGRYEALTWQDSAVTFGGIVTKPLQPAFRAGRSTSYTPGSSTPIVFNSTSGFGFNVGGYYSTSTGRFTAPVTGIYNFTTCVIWESIGSGQAMDDAFEVKVNGTTAAYSFRRAAYVANTTGIGGYYTDHATVLLNLTAGQYVEIVNRYAGLTVHGNQNYCYFTGYLVG